MVPFTAAITVIAGIVILEDSEPGAEVEAIREALADSPARALGAEVYVTGLLDPDALLGEALFPLGALRVAVILFEGALGALEEDGLPGALGVVQVGHRVGHVVGHAPSVFGVLDRKSVV